MRRAAVGDMARAETATKVRYVVLAMIFLITALNYGDRATLSVTASALKQEFGFDPVQIGYLFSAFSWAYTLSQLPAGWLLDRFGPRRVYAASILLWSVFTLLQSVAGFMGTATTIMASLFALRFMMGMAEAPAFPANAKITAMWFPAAERGMASSIFNSAQYLSAVLFTPTMAWITHTFGWEHVYITMGSIGIVAGFVWLKTMKEPENHSRVNHAELAHIRQDATPTAVVPTASTSSGSHRRSIVKQLLTSRMLLGVYLAQFSLSVLTYFFLTWFPVYLVQARGMSLMQAGVIASVPAISGFVGGLLGGLFSDGLIRQGRSLSFARKCPIVIGMLLSTSIVLCNFVSADWMIVSLMAVAFFGKGFGNMGWAVVADTSPKEVLGVCGSIFNLFGNLAGIVTPIFVGYLVASTGSFEAALYFLGVNGLIAVFSYLFIVGKIERLKLV